MEGSDAANDNSPPPEPSGGDSGSEAVATAETAPPAETPPQADGDTGAADDAVAGQAATDQAAGAQASANGTAGGEGTGPLDAANDNMAPRQVANDNAATSVEVAESEPPDGGQDGLTDATAIGQDASAQAADAQTAADERGVSEPTRTRESANDDGQVNSPVVAVTSELQGGDGPGAEAHDGTGDEPEAEDDNAIDDDAEAESDDDAESVDVLEIESGEENDPVPTAVAAVESEPPADAPPTMDGVSPPPDGPPPAARVPANDDVPNVGVRFGPYTSGPLHDIPAGRNAIDPKTNEGSVAQTFRNGSYTERVTTEPMTLYRSFGNPDGALGKADTGDVSTPSYWTRTPPRGDQPLGQAMDSAMSPAFRNDLRSSVAIQVPAGTRIFEGAAGPQAWRFEAPTEGGSPTYVDGPPIGDESVGSLGGGGDQVVLLGDIPVDWVRAVPNDQPNPAVPKP
jgi:hypothetical protein